jgi:hypothetical protein
VVVGDKGVGGMVWRADAALDLDVWITALPAGATAGVAAPIYEQYHLRDISIMIGNLD